MTGVVFLFFFSTRTILRTHVHEAFRKRIQRQAKTKLIFQNGQSAKTLSMKSSQFEMKSPQSENGRANRNVPWLLPALSEIATHVGFNKDYYVIFNFILLCTIICCIFFTNYK